MEVAHQLRFDVIDYIAIAASIVGIAAMLLLILRIVGVL